MPQNKRKRFPQRFRSALLASVAVVGVMTAAPSSAEAGFFKAIVGGIGGFFTGGWAGAAYGAYSGYTSDSGGGGGGEGGGIPPGCVPVQTGIIPKADKIREMEYGVKAGKPALGCAFVETIPGNVEVQATKAAVEAALQTKEATLQTDHQAKMRQRAELSIWGYVRKQADQFLTMLGKGNVMPWSERQVSPVFNDAYSEDLYFETPEDLVRVQREREQIARDASIESKRVSAGLAQDIGELTDRLDELEEARAACEGQTCVADVQSQINVVGVQLQAKVGLMQATHNRSQEAQADMDREARRLSDAEFDRTTRRMDTYGGSGS